MAALTKPLLSNAKEPACTAALPTPITASTFYNPLMFVPCCLPPVCTSTGLTQIIPKTRNTFDGNNTPQPVTDLITSSFAAVSPEDLTPVKI